MYLDAARLYNFALPGDIGDGIASRRTAYHRPEGNSYIERFHRSLKEEGKYGAAEYRSLEEPRTSIALVGSRSTITTGLTAESKIALRTRPSWLLQLT